MPPITRSERYRKIMTILMEEGFGTLVDQLGLRVPWMATLRSRKPQMPGTAEITPEQRARRTLERLGPTYAKMGQLMSVRADLIPESYATELAKLQDNMEPFSFAQAREQIEEAFGAPLEELFESFDEAPVGAATIGQVHLAVLTGGMPVAVKVQRPGIRQVIEADLDILRTFARRVQDRTDLGQRYDIVGLVDEFSRVLREECDYIHEGENAEKLRKAFLGDKTVYFPAVHWEMTTSNILTLDRVEGIPFNRADRLDSAGVNRREAARKGIVCYYEQIFIHGFYHADPHPGNLFACPDGSVAFTDFGRAGYLTDEARTQVADLLVAIIDQNGDEATDVLLEVSTRLADVDVVGLKRDVTALIAKYYDLKLHEVDSRELFVEIMSLIGRRGLVLSSEFALLLTTLATIQALGSLIDPEFHFVESVQPFARRIVEEETKPGNMIKNALGAMRRGAKAMQGFPENTNRALKRVADGDLRMTVRPGGYDPLMARIEQAVDRIAFALVVSSFVLGFSWLLAPTELPLWLEVVAGFTLVCSAGVGVWFFSSIVFRRFRQRPRDM